MIGRLALGVLAAVLASAASAVPALATPPEFSPPYPNAFTSTSGPMTLETVSGFKTTCPAGTNSGEVTGPATVAVTFAFTGCAEANGHCQNHSSGEIVTKPLTGTLGYLNKRHTAVGLDLSNPSGGTLVSFFCGEDVAVDVSGSLIGKLTPLNKLVEHATLRFAEKAGRQTIRRLLGGPRDVPAAKVLFGELEEAGIASTDTLAFAQPVRIGA